MKILLIIVAHAVAIALLLWCGITLNDAIINSKNHYAGVASVFSVAFGLYSTILNFLYQRNQAFHLFANRLRLWFLRTHTYWQPHICLTLDDTKPAKTSLLENIWQMLSLNAHGTAKRRTATPTTLIVSLDELWIVRFRLDDQKLFIDFEQKVLVPSHLYDRYRQRLAKLAESIIQLVKPNAIECGLLVSFEDGVKNPYYGLFINRVQPELLQNFQVSFRLNTNSSCRVEAGKDHVNIESQNLTELFEALTKVLSLKALPEGNA